MQPADAGIQLQMGRLWVIPGHMRRQASHGNDLGEAAMNQEGASLFQQVDESVQTLIGGVRQPRCPQLAATWFGKHGRLLLRKEKLYVGASARAFYRITPG
jgi:hypothetical protein